MSILSKALRSKCNGNIKTFVCQVKLAATRRLVLASLVSLNGSFAGFERIAQPPSLTARGYAVAASLHPEAVLFNPASLGSIQEIHVAFFYSPSPFGLRELSNGGAGIAYPFAFLNAGLTFTTFGFAFYKELSGTLSLAGSSAELSYGLNFQLYHLSIVRYGSTVVWGIDVGASAQLLPDLRWGFAMLNVNRPAIGEVEDQLPQIYLTGLEFQITSSAKVAVDVVKDLRWPFFIRAGTTFVPHEMLEMSVGMSSEPSRFYAGMGVLAGFLTFRYSVATHSELGYTHSVGISLEM